MPATDCCRNPEQHRLIWLGATCRLAIKTPLPSLVYAAQVLGCKRDYHDIMANNPHCHIIVCHPLILKTEVRMI